MFFPICELFRLIHPYAPAEPAAIVEKVAAPESVVEAETNAVFEEVAASEPIVEAEPAAVVEEVVAAEPVEKQKEDINSACVNLSWGLFRVLHSSYIT